jgi:5'(3')-deoxyribonucleotidase
LNIALDTDDVIFDLVSTWLHLYEVYTLHHLEKNDITDWDISKFVLPEWKNKIYDILEDIDYMDIKPIDGAIEGIKKIQQLGHTIIFATALNLKNKEKWLCENIGTDSINYVVTKNKSLLDVEVLLDDNYKNILEFNKKGQGYLFSRPWNNEFTYQPRINNWSEFVELVKIKYGDE